MELQLNPEIEPLHEHASSSASDASSQWHRVAAALRSISSSFSIYGANVPACRIAHLGDAAFCHRHGLKFPYIAGEMANGISSIGMVEAMARAGMLGMFGAAGLAPSVVENAIYTLSTRLGPLPWGFNLIHSPYEPALESSVSELYRRRGVRLVSASAYTQLTLPLVHYRVDGIYVTPQGSIVAPNQVIAKVSRSEIARLFMSPPTESLLAELVQQHAITETQAHLASRIPMAQDITVEADSGGHTDNSASFAIFPSIISLRDALSRQYRYAHPIAIGAAGGISTPYAAAAAFCMGAAYVCTGSINQTCREAATSNAVRELLSSAESSDVTMAPAADMFEMGVQLQVLKRGTLFAMRAQKLYDLYQAHRSLEEIPDGERTIIERSLFRASLDEIWNQTARYWSERDPNQLLIAEKNSKHRMALTFRWYLGQSSNWANSGEALRAMDYQIWCGPGIGAFNQWIRGSHLEAWQDRSVVDVALNILYGASILTRAHFLRAQGVPFPLHLLDVSPKLPAEIAEYLI